ncbi:hypothetical protein A2348_04510 [Candidatus Uhrbacteria bacterium RIFOXYB12_FULL_58_10]|uniref:Magnesium transporter CorA n=1 Tax=Candidatus Uhrbacteria bacterium RIFOXYB2_FULL_57_15 TaxID=1802422 RepID=A0A1F7W7H0_9BACT|nr:MAG: hypothetical protein A2348_04510 [Candidatus Uhrbacteria bacterium RIFOXYB12_FULL_58_10]OGL98741.1 MAG: hypothetical protein A2304_00995 [Candidatus Uhrbacteria bacterium RIFOXYB2_FULL_57_15]OGL99946.1 MAG: hypothetical protein A2501_04325 [Candidatus Uhrbacteria bacterium RIFOXYC12_FULL_57_11]
MEIPNLEEKAYTWWHASPCDAPMQEAMRATFKFHTLDYEDIAEATDFPKLDEYKYYAMAIIIVPRYDRVRRELRNRHFAMFLENTYFVTAAAEPIEALDRYFQLVRQSPRMRRETTKSGQPVSLLTYHVLDAVFEEYGRIIAELMRETHLLEEEVAEHNARETTIRLGALRRNVLHLLHSLEPQRRVIRKLGDMKRDFLPEEHRVYFEDLEDKLDGYRVNVANLHATVDTLFEVNETVLAHRTNDRLGTLTVISVSLMPPTLIASFYGMNVQGLPFANHLWIPFAIIVASLVVSLIGTLVTGRGLRR